MSTRVPKMKNQYIFSKAFRLEAIVGLCSVILGRVTLVEGLAPFGPAFLAGCAIAGIRPHLPLCGAILGALLVHPIHLPSILGSVLFYAAHLLYKRFAENASRLDSLFLLFLTQAVLLPVFYIDSISVLLHGLISIGLCVFSAFAMQKALLVLRSLRIRHVLSDGEQVSISILFGIVLLALSEVKYMGFSLPVILLLVFSMVAALARGIGGVAVAVAIGAVLTVGGDFTLMFVGSLAACTLAGAALRRAETLGVFGGFLAACLIVGSYVFTASHTINLPNLGLAGLVFLTIPRNRMLAVCGYLDAAKNRERYSKKSMQRLRMRTADEMERTAAVCREVAELFHTRMQFVQEPDDAKIQWITQAAANVCIDCHMQKICWQNYMQAAESVMAMLYAHEKGERIRIRKPFDPSCKHMMQMAAAAWQAQNQYLVQHAMQKQSARQYAFVNRQLTGVCQVIDQLSRRVREDRWLDEELERRLLNGLDRYGIRVYGIEAAFPQGKLLLHVRVSASYSSHPLPILEAVRKSLHRQVRLLQTESDGRQCVIIMEEAQLLTATVGMATSAISPSGVSGDCTGVRALTEGRILCALSDGMGAGANARTESEAAIRLLFDLYSCGFARDVALESVNRLLLEHCQDMYATLDAVHIDLGTGQAEFIKYGAPPTFLFRGKRLHTISAEALPAGIVDEAVPAVQTARLRRDDTVFLFSDGALDALGDQTQAAITDVLLQAKDCQMLSDLLLKRAQSCGQEDDMTVMVIRIA